MDLEQTVNKGLKNTIAVLSAVLAGAEVSITSYVSLRKNPKTGQLQTGYNPNFETEQCKQKYVDGITLELDCIVSLCADMSDTAIENIVSATTTLQLKKELRELTMRHLVDKRTKEKLLDDFNEIRRP